MAKGKGQDNSVRICFLFEAAYTLMLSCPTNIGLICNYGHTIKMLAKRTQTKLGPYIKRQICKKCHLILRPGVTSKVQLKNNNGKHMEVICLFCGTKKRFNSNPEFELFYDKIKKKI
ncbi:ribonuclease P protein subunit p21 [Caerostris darwini]|uniref:Ribonuclease P protein subunit p21 n=1 Tax=Caerostris darwini TaxID=1538125 RepID=A0AAV4V3Q1_9ARAC|nr:ribonuclease P protein subunit p21 [Caerostris darwini]